MTKKLAIVIHRVTDEVICTNSKTDLASILGISFSTVVRNYTKTGRYESGVYTIYIGVEMYKNNKYKHYKRDVEPPTVKIYADTHRTLMPNKSVILNDSNHISIQPIVDEEPIERDWRIVEKELSIFEYDKYYSKRSAEELEQSAKNFMNDSIRMKYISKYGELRLLD
jgi:hypothetical protein